MQETQETGVRSLGQEDPLEEGLATHSSILAWRIPWTEGVWKATVHGISKSWTQLSARAEGPLSLHGLESNPGSSVQTEEEAGLP